MAIEVKEMYLASYFGPDDYEYDDDDDGDGDDDSDDMEEELDRRENEDDGLGTAIHPTST